MNWFSAWNRCARPDPSLPCRATSSAIAKALKIADGFHVGQIAC
jgi:hypothetical protein